MRSSDLDDTFSSRCQLEGGASTPRRPESAPHFGLIDTIDLNGVVGAGRPLEFPSGTRLVRRRAGIDNDPAPVQGQFKAQAVGVGMRRKVWRARWADIGHQVRTVVRSQHDVPRGLEHGERLEGRTSSRFE